MNRLLIFKLCLRHNSDLKSTIMTFHPFICPSTQFYLSFCNYLPSFLISSKQLSVYSWISLSSKYLLTVVHYFETSRVIVVRYRTTFIQFHFILHDKCPTHNPPVNLWQINCDKGSSLRGATFECEKERWIRVKCSYSWNMKNPHTLAMIKTIKTRMSNYPMAKLKRENKMGCFCMNSFAKEDELKMIE